MMLLGLARRTARQVEKASLAIYSLHWCCRALLLMMEYFPREAMNCVMLTMASIQHCLVRALRAELSLHP